MKILKDTFRPEMERIKRELNALQGLSVHVGIMGDAGSEILMIAHVHEYGATINAKNVKHLAIPLTNEAKAAETPRAFDNLRYIPISEGYGFLVRDKKHPQKSPEKKYNPNANKPRTQRTGGKKDPRPNDDYEWMFMLVESVVIPERSFIRASFDTGQKELSDICKDAVDGIIRQGWTAQAAMDFIGTWAVEMTTKYFNTQLMPPKSATTMLTTTQHQPLVDTKRLSLSITYRVEGGGGA